MRDGNKNTGKDRDAGIEGDAQKDEGQAPPYEHQSATEPTYASTIGAWCGRCIRATIQPTKTGTTVRYNRG